MNISDHEIDFSDDDLKEVFGLFSSPTEHELKQTYDPDSEHYFRRIVPLEEYNLSQDKREFSLDALRGVIAFLHRHGYRIEKDGKIFSLVGILKHFIK
ncbi:MAG TPA: hypothetical protein VE732_09600 [Nitrososphaera sp.]|nr:hypothetical protein [Nitrososphaera sp.]